MRRSRITTPVLSLLLLGACSSLEGGRSTQDLADAMQSTPPGASVDPVETLLQQHTQRRADVQKLFERVVDASEPEAALKWLRVYILSLVADEQARKNEREAVAGLKEHVAFLSKQSHDDAGVSGIVAGILDDAKTLKTVLGDPAGESASAAKK